MSSSSSFGYFLAAIISAFAGMCLLRSLGRQREISKKQKNESHLFCKTQTLFRDHIYLTRMYMIAVINNLVDSQAIEQKLIETQKQISNLFISYGDTIVQNMTSLWTQHSEIASTIVLAYKEKRTDDANKAIANWKENALAISNLLCKLLESHKSGLTLETTNLCVSDVQGMMLERLSLMIDTLTSILQNDSATSMIVLDKALAQSTQLANWITQMLLLS
jgi:hypothetical protein